MSTLTLDGVSNTVLADISLSASSGDMLALVGPNGAGKTSLLKCIAQLAPYRGAVRWNEHDVQRMPVAQRARRIAYLSQNHDWSWPICVADLVALGRYPHGRRADADDAAVRRALQRAGLEALAQRPLNRLSGGERARAMLARALAVEAEVLLADEPVAALDPYHQLRMMTLLRDYCRAGHIVIVVLHDLTLASRFCDRVALLDRGRLVVQGNSEAVLSAEHIRRVYGVSALSGEHEQQRYVLPWRHHEPDAESALEPRDDDHAVRV